MIDLTEKIKIVMLKQKTSQVELAELTGQTKSNLSNKLSRNDFKLSEYEKLVNALGCTLEISIVLPSGERI